MDNRGQVKQKPKLEFEPGKTHRVELMFDDPKSGKNAKGNDWYLYGVKHDGIEKNFFANDYALHNKVKEFVRGDIIEITDNYDGDNPYTHDWHIVSVGSTKSLDEDMKDRKNTTEIKIQTYASMKIASAISSNIDELKTNTWAVIELHKEVCKSIENEEEMFDSEI